MDPIDAWLAGLVHHSVRGDACERSRHERFIIARMIAGAVALAVLPAYLLSRGIPTLLECFGIIALVGPVLGAVLVSRTGRVVPAQVLASALLSVFAAAAGAALGGPGWASALVLLIVPLEASFAGSRPALAAAAAFALLGFPATVLLDAFGPFVVSERLALTAVLAVGATLMASQAAAQAHAGYRLKCLVRSVLRATETREGATLQGVDDLITWHDRNGHVLRASPAAARLLSVAPSALHGRGLFTRIHVCDRPLFLKAISDAAASAEPVVAQFRVHTGERLHASNRHLARFSTEAGSQVIWVEMRARRLEAGPGGERNVVAVTRDISKHRQAIEDLEAARAEAEQAVAAKARLLATVSHELRTPLNAIIGFSEILTNDLPPITAEQRRDYAQIIHDSGHHLFGVVDSLLDMARLETGGPALAAEEVAVDELVDGCCDLLEVSAQRAGVAIAREVAPALPSMVADRRACRQILINLLANAVKFTPRGGLVSVKAHREDDRILFSVSDTGIGVAAEDLPRLCDPFFQGTKSVGGSQSGTGLGLSVVRGLVDLHRGSLTITSASGDGTRATVSLPIDARSGTSRLVAMPLQAVTPARDVMPVLKTG